MFAVVAAASAQVQAKDTNEKPDIVFLFCDDLGFGSIGINGARHTATPNIDKLAARGVNCTQMFSGSATCSPSRAAVITGRFPLRVDIPFAILKKNGCLRVYSPRQFPAGGSDDMYWPVLSLLLYLQPEPE